MNSASVINPRSRRRGMSLVEVLVAMAIAGVFLSGTAMAFVQIMRANDLARVRMEALANARHALDQLSRDLITATDSAPTGGTPLFSTGITSSTPILTGNLIDDDGDGAIDESEFTGVDTDGDWVAASHNRHVQLSDTNPGIVERKRLVGWSDPGDEMVLEDPAYVLSDLTFRFQPPVGTSTAPYQRATYGVTNFDGEENVLVRTLLDEGVAPGDPVTSSTGPVAFNVLSFGVLCYSERLAVIPFTSGWINTWDAGAPPFGGALRLPVSTYLTVTVYAGVIPLDKLPPGSRIETVTLTTMVNIEKMLASPQYQVTRTTY